MNHKLLCQPENFDICHFLLTQPSEDRWILLKLIKPFIERIKKVKVKIVILPQGGHYPVEQTALDTMHKTIIEFIEDIIEKNLNKTDNFFSNNDSR